MKLIIAGATGRMGRTLIEATIRAKDAQLAGAMDVAASSGLGRDASEFAGAAIGVKISADFANVIPLGDCLIDFTRPEGTLAHLQVCAKSRVRAVIGTTA